jgi:uncharacterized protein (TIGR00266 family)
MQTQTHFNPSFGLLELTLQPGESVSAESSSMVGKDTSIHLETKAKGGIFASLKRAVLGSESFFVNHFTCKDRPGTLYLAPAISGSVETISLKDGSGIFIQTGSYLASTGIVSVDAKWGGARTFFSSEGLFVLKATGTGDVYINSYGAIHRVDLTSSSYIVDTGSLVAWTENLQYVVTKVGGLKSLFLSGEGLVCRLTGTGSLWLQSRSPDGLASFLHPFRRVEVKKQGK